MSDHITNIDRATTIRLAQELGAAINAVLASHGLAETQLSGSYSANEVSFRFKTSVVSVNPETGVNESSPEAVEYLRFGTLMGLPAGLLGTEFVSRGIAYVFLGLNRKAHKFPVLARRVADGKTYKLPLDAIAPRPGL